jgi:hypothetical protein
MLRGPGKLELAGEELEGIRPLQAAEAGIAGQADGAKLAGVVAAYPKKAAERVAIGEEAARQCLAHDGDRR